MKNSAFVSLFFLSLCLTLSSSAAPISDIELYQRCHAHLTGTAPKLNDIILKDILDKRISAIQACKDMLKLATLNGARPLLKTNKKGIQVLDTFFKIHSSWFENKIFEGDNKDSSDIYESSPGGLFYTKALFDPNYKFSDIFSGTQSFDAIRSDGEPELSPFQKVAAKDYKYTTTGTTLVPFVGLKFPQIGLLEGIKPDIELTVTNIRGNAGQHIVNGSLGGGLLGNRNYVMKATAERGLDADGAVQMPRRWGRAIFLDFLCQDLPVVNTTTDSNPYVAPSSTTAFRTTSGCVSCHASMDQLSGLIRNYNTETITRDLNRTSLPIFHKTESTNTPYAWKSNGDSNYKFQTPRGKFYYRTLAGQLIDRDVANIEALGNLMVGLNDMYMCTASRYLEHFTGVKFPISRVTYEPSHSYSKAIKSLSTDLKANQNPMGVVESILSSDIYKDSKFMVGE